MFLRIRTNIVWLLEVSKDVKNKNKYKVKLKAPLKWELYK